MHLDALIKTKTHTYIQPRPISLKNQSHKLNILWLILCNPCLRLDYVLNMCHEKEVK